MTATITVARDADRLPIGTIGWDRRGAPIAKDAAGWFVVGGGRIADLSGHLPLEVPRPRDVDGATILGDTPCETCATQDDLDALPKRADPGPLVDQVAELIRIEFPAPHPHSRVNRLRSESAAARIITFLAAEPVAQEHDVLAGDE